MALRDCKHCWKTLDDEEHYWFCPFASGIHPSATKGTRRGTDDGGGGGNEPGERNIPPLPDAPGGGGVCIELTAESKSAITESAPLLALPVPVEIKDDDAQIRSDRVGER